MTRAAIFDLDGTLIDSLSDIADLMNETLLAASLPTHPQDAYRNFVGSGITVLAERATAGLDVDVAALVIAFRERYRSRPVRRTRPFEGIPELLAGLQARGVALAVLSNKPHALTTAITRELFAVNTFAEVWGHKDEFPRKPDPTSAHAVSELLGVLPEQCLFVGDTDIDMRTASNSGMRPIGVVWGFRPVSELMAAGADRVLERPAELLELLD
jgi:phosphoglycolate phosphatase